MTSLAYELAVERFEYNKLVGYKSIVPVVQLSWNLARFVKITDAKLFDLIKQTISLSLKQCFLVLDLLCQLGREVKWHGRTDNEVAHYCNVCEVCLTYYIIHLFSCLFRVFVFIYIFILLPHSILYYISIYINFS